MAWKQVSTSGQTLDIKKLGEGKQYTGVYKGSKDIDTKIGKQTVYSFVSEDEESFGIYGFTNLNRAMINVKIDDMVRITYQGMQNLKTKFGMKDVHIVKVEVEEAEEKAEEIKF